MGSDAMVCGVRSRDQVRDDRGRLPRSVASCGDWWRTLNRSPLAVGIENRPPNCPSSPEARLILFSGVVRPLGRKDARELEADTPWGVPSDGSLVAERVCLSPRGIALHKEQINQRTELVALMRARTCEAET